MRFISFIRLPGLPPAPGSQSDGVRQGGRSGIHAAERQPSRACPTRSARPTAEASPARSEERRVGKECKSGGSPCPEKERMHKKVISERERTADEINVRRQSTLTH